jgi:outer membrane lipoprotein carrier protein
MIIDFYGNGNEIMLSNVRQGVELDDGLFEFVPPEGVQVEDNTGAY